MVGGQILFLFCALFFALLFSTLNAYYLNNNGYGNEYGVRTPVRFPWELCDRNFNYSCGGLFGQEMTEKTASCLTDVINDCKLNSDDKSKLELIYAKNQIVFLEYEKGKYFIYSCPKIVFKNYEAVDPYMSVNIDQWREKRYYNVDSSYLSSDYVKMRFPYDDIESEQIIKSKNAFNDVKMAADEVLKTIDEAKKVANEIKNDGELFKKEVDKMNENVKKIVTNLEEKLESLKDHLHVLNGMVYCYSIAPQTLRGTEWITSEKATVKIETDNYLNLVEQTRTQIKEIKKEANKLSRAILFEKSADDAYESAKESLKTAEEAKEAAMNATKVGEKAKLEAMESKAAGEDAKKDAKKIGEEAKKEAKESKEIGENSNKTANFAVEIGIKAKMAANESMKIGNEANQKIIEVEKLAKDSLKLAETNQKAGDKTVAEVQKLKSSGEKIGCKFGIFAILLFAYIFFY